MSHCDVSFWASPEYWILITRYKDYCNVYFNKFLKCGRTLCANAFLIVKFGEKSEQSWYKKILQLYQQCSSPIHLFLETQNTEYTMMKSREEETSVFSDALFHHVLLKITSNEKWEILRWCYRIRTKFKLNMYDWIRRLNCNNWKIYILFVISD